MTLRLLAPAKINLVLEVLGRRPDGYHDLASVVHAVALYDTLEFDAADALAVTITGARIGGEHDLALRAARLLRQRLAEPRGARIRVRKRIPVAAGLGGGSSDAAATLRGLAALWRRPDAAPLLAEVAALLGSDVPLFLTPGAALLDGRGEIVTPLPALRGVRAVLIPRGSALRDKTARLFGALRPEHFSDGARTQAAATALRRGELPGPDLLFNAFEPVARALHPGLAAVQDALSAACGARFHVAGAGPSLYALCGRHEPAATVFAAASRLAPEAICVRLVGAARPLRRGRGTPLAFRPIEPPAHGSAGEE